MNRRELAKAISGVAELASPTVSAMRKVAEAELALAQGNKESALRILDGLAVDGAELCIVHTALMNVHEAMGNHAKAREEALWLLGHRGRAYTEYNADWIARPFNVAQTNLAWLVAAEQSVALGDKAKAREYLAGFKRIWPSLDRVPTLATRLRKVADAL